MSFKAHFEAPRFAEFFPIKSDNELKSIDEMINDDNKSEFVSTLRRVIGAKGLQRGITNVFSNDIILNYNARGIQGKKRLLDFKKLIDVLFLASTADGCTEYEFIVALRNALKAAKNKHFKTNCLKNKVQKENLPDE
ncbi:uncharacterized protein LOC142237868 [Haematobia irritans]